MPLFSRGSDGEAERDAAREHDEDGQGVADERTRLLPPSRNDSSHGPPARSTLSPDDPSVSPYNLWSVRALRYLTVALTLVTFVWWMAILVSAFATPPGFHMRGSGFFAYGYASLAFANMLFTLLFFGAPSQAGRVLVFIIAFLLLVNVIVLLAVEKTRYEEGWVGTVSVVWAVLMSLWTILTDRTVKWGKQEEEQRLTGRVETRRSLTEWTEVLVSTIAYTIMLVATLLITLTLVLRALDAGVAPPGKLYWVDGDNYRIHVYCRGDKTDSHGARLPTVLFEGGEQTVEAGLWKFADDSVKNGSISRYCFADRPGLAWSDTAPSPLSASFAVDALSEALAAAGETGPWVLAGAGIGSIYARVFSSRHGEEIKGLVLVDPLHEDLLGRVAAPGRGFLLWLRGAISPLGLDRLPGAILRGRTSRDRIYGRSAQQNDKFIFAKLQESLVAGSFTRRDVESSRSIQHKDTPLIVISSGEHIKKDSEWQEKQRDLTTLTDNLQHWDIVDKAPHQVWETAEGRASLEKRLKQLVHG